MPAQTRWERAALLCPRSECMGKEKGLCSAIQGAGSPGVRKAETTMYETTLISGERACTIITTVPTVSPPDGLVRNSSPSQIKQQRCRRCPRGLLRGLMMPTVSVHATLCSAMRAPRLFATSMRCQWQHGMSSGRGIATAVHVHRFKRRCAYSERKAALFLDAWQLQGATLIHTSLHLGRYHSLRVHKVTKIHAAAV